MMQILEKLALYWTYPFVRYALAVGVLIALCSSLLGVTLVLKRFSFIGDGLSHVAFGAMAIAGILQVKNEMPLVMAITILSAVLLLRTGQHTKIKGDAAVAMISVGALAVGYLLMNLFSSSSNLSGDVCSTLFGSTSILTLSKSEVWLCAGLSVVVVAVFLLFYNKIFAVTFDEDFAKAVGTKADLYNLLIAVIIAVVIVLAMNLVGSLLISALVIFPALSAMRVFQNFRSVTVCSAVLSVSCAVLGILISVLAGTPVGSTIVAVDILAFLICSAIGRARRGSGMKQLFCLLLTACMAVSLCACGKGREKDAGNDASSSDEEASAQTEIIPTPNEQETPGESRMSQPSAGKVDVDLTVLSSTMVYSEVYNMLYNDPAHYLGKTVKARGMFSIYQLVADGVLQPDPVSVCILSDAAACCAEGIEFVLEGDYTYPDDYPELGTEITVIGEFQSYEANGMTWYHLVNARLA